MNDVITEIEMDEIELSDRPIESHLSFDWNEDIHSVGVNLQTEKLYLCGSAVIVHHGGDKRKPAIVTFHDLGLNSISCFSTFFNYTDMQPILEHFCVFHIEAPGQENNAQRLDSTFDIKEEKIGLVNNEMQNASDVFRYPSAVELSNIVNAVVKHFQLKSIIGFGCGVGAWILSHFALHHPDKTEALVLINPNPLRASWGEWGYQKLNILHLKRGTISTHVSNYFNWYWFGYDSMEKNVDLVKHFQHNLSQLNPFNLSLFIESYISRPHLDIRRPPTFTSAVDDPCHFIRCPILLIVGDNSPHVDATTEMNTHLDPVNTTFFKVMDAGGMVLEEQPGKICEAFRLFVQGFGHVPHLSQAKIVAFRNKMLRRQSKSSSNVQPDNTPNDGIEGDHVTYNTHSNQLTMESLDQPSGLHKRYPRNPPTVEEHTSLIA